MTLVPVAAQPPTSAEPLSPHDPLHPIQQKWRYVTAQMALRRSEDSSLIRQWQTIANHDRNDVVIPLPNVKGAPNMNMLTPGLVHDGIEGTAMAASGPDPNAYFPAVGSGPRAAEYARTRKRATQATWHHSRLRILLRRAYRQLCGYGSMAMVVVPDFKEGRARIEFRNAMGSYPEPRAAEDIRAPENIGFVFGRSEEWIVSRYPEAREYLSAANRRPAPRWQAQPSSNLWDVVEWIDNEHIMMGILGPRDLYLDQSTSLAEHAEGGFLLRAWTNLAGRCTAACPRRVTLQGVAGQLDNIIPVVEWMARFMAIDTLAAEEAIWSDMVAIGTPNGDPRIISHGGEWQDGRTGKINLLADVTDVRRLQASPGPMTDAMMNRLESAAMRTGGISSMTGGELPRGGDPRTGRAMGTLYGMSVDPRVAELQEIMAYCLADINSSIIDVERGYWPDKEFEVFSGWAADPELVKYTPSKHFESRENVVTYTFPGTDISRITVEVAQLSGSDLISKQTARDKHPYIDDPEFEARAVLMEKLDEGMAVAMQQKAVSGEMHPIALAAAQKSLMAGESMAVATEKANAAMQAEQAKQQELMAAQQQLQAPIPEAQPGLGGGPLPEQLAAEAQPGPAPEQRNLAQLVQSVAAPAFYGNK